MGEDLKLILHEMPHLITYKNRSLNLVTTITFSIITVGLEQSIHLSYCHTTYQDPANYSSGVPSIWSSKYRQQKGEPVTNFER